MALDNTWQQAQLSSIDSINNSTTIALGSNAVFTGVADLVTDVAVLQIEIFSDQASLINGFSFQWSSDSINWDVSDNTSLFASIGRSFAITPRGKYFRIVYTNGSIAQGIFRLQTCYRQVGTGIISRLLSAATSEDNFAISTRAFLSGKDSSGNFNNINADADNTTNGPFKIPTLSARANVTVPTWSEGNQVPLSTDLAGRLRILAPFGSTATYGSSTNGAIASPTAANSIASIAYLFHPSTNTKKISILKIILSWEGNAGNNELSFRGTFITAENGTPGGISQTINSFDPNDPVSTLIFRTGANTPTRVTGDIQSIVTIGASTGQFLLFNADNGRPLILPASINRGFEIRVVIGGSNISSSVGIGINMIWVEE